MTRFIRGLFEHHFGVACAGGEIAGEPPFGRARSWSPDLSALTLDWNPWRVRTPPVSIPVDSETSLKKTLLNKARLFPASRPTGAMSYRSVRLSRLWPRRTLIAGAQLKLCRLFV